MESQRFDVVVVGAGMAGASIAAELAPHARVLLLEAEERPGYHATGRSAAFWMESYGGPAVQPLTAASHAFLSDPPVDWAIGSLLDPLGCLHVANRAGTAALAALARDFAGSDVRLEPVDRAGLEEAVRGLRPGWSAGLRETNCAAIEVAALHAGYLAALRRAGGTLRCGLPVRDVSFANFRWRLAIDGATIEAPILVNAAGAWADELAVRAGVRPIGILPYRRTIVQVRVDPAPPAAMPLIIDAAGRFYFKPEAGGRLWLSPHDETLVEPGDAAADEIDVAGAIDSLQSFVDWSVEAVERRWAGLRSFAPDRLPVYGFDVRAAGFFWFAGQGGYGIQTAPAAAKLAAASLLGIAPGPIVAGIDPARFGPDRFG